MKIYKSFLKRAEPCPICETKDDKECIAVPVDGTESEDGKKMEAILVHGECLGTVDMHYNADIGVIYFQASKKELKSSIILPGG